MARLTRWCLRHRLVVVALWLAALAGAGAAVLSAGAVYSNDYGVTGTESVEARELLSEGFPQQAGDSGTVVWHADGGRGGGGDVTDRPVQHRMGEALDEIAELPGVAQVTGPYGAGAAGGRISDDGSTAYATVHFAEPAEDLDKAQVGAVVATARAAADDVDGLDVALGGAGVALTEGTTSHLSELVGVAAAAVVLLLAFGSLAAMLLPLVTALVSVGTAYLGTGLLGHAMALADFAPMLGTLIGLGVGIDYALFIVTRHRRGLKQGLPVAVAAERAVASAGRAVVFAGATVCIALMGMLVLRLDFLNGVAVASSLTVVLAVLASVTLLPSLLGAIGMRALSRRERARLAAGHTEAAEGGGGGRTARWSAFLERHPKLLGGVAAAVMAVLALPVLGLHLGTSDQGNGPATATTRQAYDMLSDGFGPGANGPLTLVAEIDGAPGKLAFDDLPDRLRGTKGVAAVTDATLNGSGDTGVITVVPETSPQARATSRLVERLRADVVPQATESSTLNVRVGGLTASYDDFATVILGKLPLFLGVVVALGSVLLLVAFRSIGIPVKAAVMNVLAVAGSFGVVIAVFQWGWGSGLLGLGGAGPIEPFLPVIMIAVLFGLSMDYQVFLVSRMYEEWRLTGDNRRAVRVGLAETGRVINSAAAIMIAVFGAFVLSGDRIIAMFGIGLAVAVALDAFVLRTLLVPALMHLLGGANWWLPGWLERRLPRFSIEPEPVPVPAAVPAAADGDSAADTAAGGLVPEQRGDVRTPGP
ncbi:MMPL family transporter [Streptomyces armeniacus]|uniref:MMPL family transporter n=1 Tax=Streptomyces armeniacus TaxID=83291 RepID=A0A345XRU2_9ACTN|nr:MMPL family transporter [Streptomyces armeniacus]AXK34358.1 MMPL family transporter [Streptomyces armeniacus]